MPRFPTQFRVLVLREPLTLYRGSHGADDLSVEAALTSNFQARRTPHPADRHATVVHMAVSMFDRPEPVTRLAHLFPGRIGTHLIRVDLAPGQGFCVADTGQAGHWSVWGVPTRFVACVSAVWPFELSQRPRTR